MELNREQIVKALECQVGTDENHDCRGCYFYREGGLCTENMSRELASRALALIRELTESLDRVQKQCGEIIVECDERDAERLKQVAKLTDENERLSDLLTETEIPFEQALDRYKYLESENERLQKVIRDTKDNEEKDRWICTSEKLPRDGELVLIWDGCVHSARFTQGIDEEDRKKMENGDLPNPDEPGWSLSTGFVMNKRSQVYRRCDVGFNNTVPYCWESTNSDTYWFGQAISHWMPYPKPLKMKTE